VGKGASRKEIAEKEEKRTIHESIERKANMQEKRDVNEIIPIKLKENEN